MFVLTMLAKVHPESMEKIEGAGCIEAVHQATGRHLDAKSSMFSHMCLLVFSAARSTQDHSGTGRGIGWGKGKGTGKGKGKGKKNATTKTKWQDWHQNSDWCWQSWDWNSTTKTKECHDWHQNSDWCWQSSDWNSWSHGGRSLHCQAGKRQRYA